MLYFAPSFPSVLILFSFSVYVFFFQICGRQCQVPRGIPVCGPPSIPSAGTLLMSVPKEISLVTGCATELSQTFRKEISLVHMATLLM